MGLEFFLKLQKSLRERENLKQDFIEAHGYVQPPRSAQGNGKTLSVVGGEIYIQSKEGPYNFINLIHDHALMFFGKRVEEEELLPLQKRHPALQWLHVLVENSAPNYTPQIGAGASWFRFAYDLFTIKDNARLESRIRERLLNPKDFQGARHELFVAALCIAADFEVDFEDETKNSVKHTEFIAYDRQSSAKIAIEAKSRHRKGVKGFVGGKDITAGEKVGVRDLVVDGFSKLKELPLYLFVDVNLPPATLEQYDIWMGEIDSLLNNFEIEGYDPCPANGIFFTNDPSHYILDKEIDANADLWIRHVQIRDSYIQHPDINISKRLMKAWEQRNVPPENFPGF